MIAQIKPLKDEHKFIPSIPEHLIVRHHSPNYILQLGAKIPLAMAGSFLLFGDRRQAKQSYPHRWWDTTSNTVHLGPFLHAVDLLI